MVRGAGVIALWALEGRVSPIEARRRGRRAGWLFEGCGIWFVGAA
jgi:hypothetical protein